MAVEEGIGRKNGNGKNVINTELLKRRKRKQQTQKVPYGMNDSFCTKYPE